MEVIHYLNHTAQLFSAAADVVTTESTESAGILRSLSSARLFHASNLWSIASQKNEQTKYPYSRWSFCALPTTCGVGFSIDDVITSLKSTIETEKALQASSYESVWTSQHNVFDGIIKSSKTTVMLLERIISRLASDTAKTWICQNCFSYTEDRSQGCQCCGMGKNWLKSSGRF